MYDFKAWTFVKLCLLSLFKKKQIANSCLHGIKKTSEFYLLTLSINVLDVPQNWKCYRCSYSNLILLRSNRLSWMELSRQYPGPNFRRFKNFEILRVPLLIARLVLFMVSSFYASVWLWIMLHGILSWDLKWAPVMLFYLLLQCFTISTIFISDIYFLRLLQSL